MNKEKITYLGTIIVIVLLVGTLIFGIADLTGDSNKQVNNKNKAVYENDKVLNPELEKYRIESIPEVCRLPEYEEEVQSWKEHLSHHQETLYCLDYYK